MASPAIAAQELMLEERIKFDGATHRIVIDYTDLTDTAGTAKTLQVLPYIARDIVRLKVFDLVKPFDGGSTSALNVIAGWNGGSVDDANGLLEATELHADATEILAGAPNADASTVDGTYGAQEQAVIASLRALFAGLQAQEAGNIELVFTATGANLTALTQGKLFLYLQRIRLSDATVRPLSAP